MPHELNVSLATHKWIEAHKPNTSEVPNDLLKILNTDFGR